MTSEQDRAHEQGKFEGRVLSQLEAIEKAQAEHREAQAELWAEINAIRKDMNAVKVVLATWRGGIVVSSGILSAMIAFITAWATKKH